MTTVPPAPDEPPPPQRGLTREERGRDVSEPQAAVETEPMTGRRLLRAMNPRYLLSQADGYPVVLKQFIQFCLIIIYPAWLLMIVGCAAIYYLILLPGYYVLLAVGWVVFWPLRMRLKRKNPEEYEQYRKKYWRR